MKPVSPSEQATVTSAPSASLSVASPQPTTAGMPSSRAMMAAWQVRPPRLVTMALALLHHRLPVRVGHVGDEHVARLHAVHLGDRAHEHDAAGADLLADRAALGQQRRFAGVALQLVAVLDLAGALALHRLGPRLQDVELAVDAVLAPLDVHRPAVVLLDDHRVARQLLHVGIDERVAVAHLDRVVFGLHELAARRLFLRAS